MQMLSKDPSERPDAKELIKFCEMAFCRLRCSELPKFKAETYLGSIVSDDATYELGDDGTMFYDRDTEFDVAPVHFTQVK